MLGESKTQWGEAGIARIIAGIWLEFKAKWMQSGAAAECEFQAEWGEWREANGGAGVEWRASEIEEWEYVKWVINK